MRESLRIALLASFVLFHSSLASAGTAEPVCGDVNDSGTVNTSDALQVLRKGVGQPVTLDCSAYDDRFELCSVDLTACSSGSKCGDAVVNSVGEHCDEEDLGGADCTTFGYGAGTLGCDENCRYDTSGCSVCPEGVTLYHGVCWVLAAVPVDEGVGSCDTACTSIGLTCDEIALQAIGSDGSDVDCRLAADAADPEDAPHVISPLAVESRHLCGPPTDYSVGCNLAEGLGEEADGSIRILYDGSGTLCEADYYGGPCGTPVRRVCACKP